MSKKLIGVLCAVLFLVAGCAGPYAISHAYGTNTIFSVEPRDNGSTVVWFTNDDVGFYCTMDARLGEKALSLRGASVVFFEYASINWASKEAPLLGTSGCPMERGSGTTGYVLLALQSGAEFCSEAKNAENAYCVKQEAGR